MKAKTIALTISLVFVSVALGFQNNPQMGTWKLNDAKSKIGTGGPKLSTVIYEPVGDSVKITVDGVDGDGKPLHSEWTGKFDGKDYPVTGDSNNDKRSYRKINDHTLTFTNKTATKIVSSGRVVVAADGKPDGYANRRRSEG